MGSPQTGNVTVPLRLGFNCVLDVFQTDADQENDKDEAPESPASPSGRRVVPRREIFQEVETLGKSLVEET